MTASPEVWTPPDGSSSEAPRPTLAGYRHVRSYTEALAAPLSAEDQTVQSMPDVSPTKWHRAHTTWFFETFVLPLAKGYKLFDDQYGYLFNSYYESVGERYPRPQRGLVTRPGIEEIARYRQHVDSALESLLAAGSLDDGGVALVELGLHHEQQHQELLLMDIRHVLSLNPLEPVYRVSAGLSGADQPVRWVEHPGGLAEIGHSGDGFAFDNEQPRHEVKLLPFAVAERPVSCGDWLAFMADGGYERADLWLSDGWAAVRAQQWDSPLYWRGHDDGRWSVFTLGGSKPVDPGQPVSNISYYEADAFARWAGARLPTEAEWEVAAAARWPTTDDYGKVWEWTASAYLPYPGFRTAPGAVGEYNGKFMVGQHILRGGSFLTSPGHARLTYRNFFPPSARWATAGTRLARDI